MANCQNNMRYARRSMQSMQPDQSVQSKQSAQNSQGCRQQMNGCPDTHDHFPADMPIGMAYVPWQKWQDIYEHGKGLECGTIFKELDKPFLGKGGIRR